jgi:hypothetical protein
VTTSGPKRGYVYRCGTGGGEGGAFRDGPWIKTDGTYDLTAKAIVDGAVSWPGTISITVQGPRLVIRGNGLPRSATSGIYPVQASDDAYRYDRNPNSIRAQSISYSLPAKPKVAAKPRCLTAGPIGITLNGVVFFDGLDALNRDAVAHEVQDACGGHPERTGTYHYHATLEYPYTLGCFRGAG